MIFGFFENQRVDRYDINVPVKLIVGFEVSVGDLRELAKAKAIDSLEACLLIAKLKSAEELHSMALEKSQDFSASAIAGLAATLDQLRSRFTN